jgi:O-antigen ligase
VIDKSSMQSALRNSVAWGVILIWSCPLLLPFGRTVEIPVLLMAFLGALLLSKNWRAWRHDKRVRLLCSVFALSWVPMLLSLPDAVDASKTGEVVLNHLRFILSGLFVLHILNNDRAWQLFTHLLSLLLAFWVVDAVVQYWKGTDLFGVEPFPGRLSAMFGPGNSKFGLTLAVFLPVVWEYARRCMGAVAATVAVLLTVTVVVLTDQRSAWILVAAATGIYAFCLCLWLNVIPVRSLAAVMIAAMICITSSYFFFEKFESGIDRSLAALSSHADPKSNSIVHRFWIWRGAWSMIKDNPLNGVGARGFRYAFDSYAEPDDPYLKQDQSNVPTHSHQLLIEIAAETGLFGLVGFILMGILLVRAAILATYPERICILPYAACVGAAYFPLNTHLAIYSAYWSQIVWYLIALYCAAPAGGTHANAAINASETRSTEK